MFAWEGCFGIAHVRVRDGSRFDSVRHVRYSAPCMLRVGSRHTLVLFPASRGARQSAPPEPGMAAPDPPDGHPGVAAPQHCALLGSYQAVSRDYGPCNICSNPTAHDCVTCVARLWLTATPRGPPHPPRAEPPHKLCHICEFDQELRCCSDCKVLFAGVAGHRWNPEAGPSRGHMAPLHRSWQLLKELEQAPDPADIEEDAALPDRKGLIRDDRTSPSSTSLPLGMPPITVPDFHGVMNRSLPQPGTWCNLAMNYETATLGCPPVFAFVFWNIREERWERFAALTGADGISSRTLSLPTSVASRPVDPATAGPSGIPPAAIRMGQQAYSAMAEAATAAARAATPGQAGPCCFPGYCQTWGTPGLWSRPASRHAPAGWRIPPQPPWPPPDSGRGQGPIA